MQMKAQLEMEKEETRRKEMLANRHAQHIEATMRFQKGIKNFRINKGE
jgi:t-SNARE complex subunit (syntaxin)